MNSTQKTTLNLPEYNQETGKHTITLEINKTSKKYNYKVFELASCILSWKSMIQDALQERLVACKNNLAAAVLRDDIVETSEYSIRYVQNGLIRHYSYPAAKAMERVISELNEEKLDWLENPMCTQQVLKALAWIPLDKRETLDGYPYQVLVDTLWESNIVNNQYKPEQLWLFVLRYYYVKCLYA